MTVKKELYKKYNDWVQDNMAEVVYGDNRQVTAWYRNDKGVNWVLWPAGLVRYWWITCTCRMQDYHVKY